MNKKEKIKVIEGFFYLTFIENKGAAWSILQNGRYFLIILGIIISCVIIYLLTRVHDRLAGISLSFILGGGIGNLIDRIFRGSVVDFLDFYIGSYNYPTFNAADCFIVVGTILLAYYILFVYKEKDKIRF